MEQKLSDNLAIIIFGASGDLTRRKLLPALFNLYKKKLFPKQWKIYGFARSDLTGNAFPAFVAENLKKYYSGKTTEKELHEFISHCTYIRGQYDNSQSIRQIPEAIIQHQGQNTDKILYMSIPPDIFGPTLIHTAQVGLLQQTPDHFVRIILEKPFGHDTESARELIKLIEKLIPDEQQIYRIDHYLAKEVIQNLMVLRFANTIFEPIWNRHYIRQVQISFSEDIGVGSRAGYFDHSGIIRDVIQNHLLQILALVAMEQPSSFEPDGITREKLKVFSSIAPIHPTEVVTGQYTANTVNGTHYPGYLEEPGVPPDSITETFARIKLFIRNQRWMGVPFYLQAGKALNSRKTEIEILFEDVFFRVPGQDNPPPNKLTIQVQPDESILLHMNNKKPGHGVTLQQVPLRMHYQETFHEDITEAYERLLHDVMHGDRNLFVTNEEVIRSWEIITPVLNYIANNRKRPLAYPFGSAGPLLMV
ncbi:MAG: glucose-6-phosphate dehydrogenase [Lentisphaerae bacterium]|nr:MAG: glucose-6-phosphate dehydrogenase [Lentisphaerota bacterium]